MILILYCISASNSSILQVSIFFRYHGIGIIADFVNLQIEPVLEEQTLESYDFGTNWSWQNWYIFYVSLLATILGDAFLTVSSHFTALVVRFITKRFIGEYDPTLEKIYTFHTILNDDMVNFEILDTAGATQVS